MRQLGRTIVRLNVETQAFHAAADAPWLGLIADGRPISRFDYVELLVRQYGFDAPLESALAYTPHLDGMFPLHQRFRAGALAQDLLNVGLAPSSIAQLRQCMIAPFASVAEALGWLYVHERSTLLHEAVLSQVLQRNSELAPATTCLQRDVGFVGVQWDDFGQMVDRVARTRAIEDRIIESAHDAFRSLLAWYGARAETSRAESR